MDQAPPLQCVFLRVRAVLCNCQTSLVALHEGLRLTNCGGHSWAEGLWAMLLLCFVVGVCSGALVVSERAPSLRASNATWEFEFVEFGRLPVHLEGTAAVLDLTIAFGAGDHAVPEDVFRWPCSLPEPAVGQRFCFGEQSMTWWRLLTLSPGLGDGWCLDREAAVSLGTVFGSCFAAAHISVTQLSRMAPLPLVFSSSALAFGVPTTGYCLCARRVYVLCVDGGLQGGSYSQRAVGVSAPALGQTGAL
jgi:hypothetical protein